VVRRLLGLCRFRNEHPAFDGEFEVSGEGSSLRLAWREGDDHVAAEIDVADSTFCLTSRSDEARLRVDSWEQFEEPSGSWRSRTS
jgi:sucrose phosphorylase